MNFLLRLACVISAVLSLGLSLELQHANASQDEAVGQIESLFGNVTIERAGEKIQGKMNLPLYQADLVQVLKNSTAMIRFSDGSSVVASEQSAITVSQYKARAAGKALTANMILDVIRGKLRFFFKKTNATVRTKNATIGVRGTTFFVDASSSNTMVMMVQGKVAVANLATPNKFVDLQTDQLTRILDRASPETPIKVPDNIASELKRAFKSVDLGKAGGFVEAPKVEPSPTAPESPKEKSAPAEEQKDTSAPKPVQDGKLVVAPSGESTLAPATAVAPIKELDDLKAGQNSPSAATRTTDTPTPTVDPAAAVEKTMQQITTSAQRPIDAKKTNTTRKTKVGVSAP
jgi:hypothetical protein